MKIIKESVNTDSIKVGDLISYDSNYLGVTPRIHKGKVIEIGRGLGSHGDPRAPKIFTVRDEEGKKYKVDEYAVEEIITESYSENQLFNEIKNICLSDVKDWSNVLKSGNIMITIPDAGSVLVKPYSNKIGIYDYETGNLDIIINSVQDFKRYLKRSGVLDKDINEDNERSYNPLSDINHLIGKEYSDLHRLEKDLDSLGYDLIYHNDDYIHITDAMESDDIRYIYQINHNKNGSISIGRFIKEEEL